MEYLPTIALMSPSVICAMAERVNRVGEVWAEFGSRALSQVAREFPRELPIVRCDYETEELLVVLVK